MSALGLEPLPRGVILAATPLGNVGDASARLMQALAHADVIAAEDTRRVRNLAQALGIEISGSVVSNFDHNEQARARQLIDAAQHGTVLVVTDAGMPIISDPGLSLVAAAAERDIPVTCFPGPSAVPTALALSGLGVGHFLFDAFPPRKAGPRKAWLESLRNEKRAIVFFESPHRIAETLADAAQVLGSDRPAAVCRELTKTYEEIRRGTLAELAEWASGGAKGEITVVIEGGTGAAVTAVDLVPQALELAEAGMRLKDACKQAAKGTGVSNRELYDAAVDAR
ncbi:16S rRNA (cytidine(1402)-2'-O)-methyltransferase [Corynebacterium macginleyi]|uniref:Ribosomal RNA small subunit methyltransferase I n=1 Tax=Corynebacterium macginleyi TaxID=38290 RepID=A0A3M0G8B8_9CORY|nr:16S rRNA (cytidine(1402)-2'-O)-methyltransferase [Corynebacterium macginleyi]MBK4139418.1 16S rRNA (cytidine(1402)-2'-O)-methyltransferase [Corynebacterium macginleyi]MBK4141311.1 16S rRNA (cytidine(1402)-2'-O)-methyltransferase [Corynebacterium macginleyi]MBK4144823.1 16S rRNA (cytidine(1402)-2'-O)-methyltransferase [Corynebacterium macginleyi]MBK4148125.1 16S rRNA (cytidine(1402)-2'-O)-methyltransferase [Corynebacterium macginleyi]MBK4151098.1 16S rRNA (cytidine(1402)-2'-O)-methyltransfer